MCLYLYVTLSHSHSPDKITWKKAALELVGLHRNFFYIFWLNFSYLVIVCRYSVHYEIKNVAAYLQWLSNRWGIWPLVVWEEKFSDGEISIFFSHSLSLSRSLGDGKLIAGKSFGRSQSFQSTVNGKKKNLGKWKNFEWKNLNMKWKLIF
jgi:hypothetical protein